jgi:hypothetical protein
MEPFVLDNTSGTGLKREGAATFLRGERRTPISIPVTGRSAAAFVTSARGGDHMTHAEG